MLKVIQNSIVVKMLCVMAIFVLGFVVIKRLSSEVSVSQTYTLRMEKAAKISLRSSNGGRALAGSFDFILKPNPQFENLNVTQASKKFLQLVTSFKSKCQEAKRFGKPGDGGYMICMDGYVAPKKNRCLVYSFGIRNEWSFDDAVHDQLGCEVHSFDPSMNATDHKRKKRLYFHNLGIWDKLAINELGWKLASLNDIIKMMGHQNRVIDYMKVDVEGAEWPMLKEMLQENSVKNVKQMIFEIHTPKYKGFPMEVADYGDIYTDLNNLETKLGFKLWKEAHTNGCCDRFASLTQKHFLSNRDICCYELFYINKKYL